MDTHYLLEMQLLRDKVESFDQYPYSLPVIKNFESLKFHPKVTFIVGENGSGKSTLLEAIATSWGFNPEGGTKNFNFSTRSSHSDLWQKIRLSKSFRRPKDGFFLRAESFYNVASNIDELGVIQSYGGTSLHQQSHGESFFALMLNRFSGQGLYILDEPEAALSPTRQMAMLSRMSQLVEDDSQFVIATHSPILMAYPDANILQINDAELELTKYERTDHFKVTKDFLDDYKRITEYLIQPDDN